MISFHQIHYIDWNIGLSPRGITINYRCQHNPASWEVFPMSDLCIEQALMRVTREGSRTQKTLTKKNYVLKDRAKLS